MRAHRLARHWVAAARLWYRLWTRLRSLLGIKRTTYVQERVPFYRSIWTSAAADLGLELVALSDTIWEVRRDDVRIARLHNYIVSLDDPVTLDVAGDKLLTYRLLAEAGVSTPPHVGVTIRTLNEIERFVDRHAGPYVIKPARNTSSGLGVTTHLRGLRECLSAAALAFNYCDEILIEPYVVGESYRLLFLGHELVCASRRAGMRVTGDGERSIAELMAATSDGSRPNWRADLDVGATLEAQGLSLDTVPSNGVRVLVRGTGHRYEGSSEVRTVYTEDVTRLLCEEIVDQGRRASLALGSEFCGVDVLTLDPAVALERSGGAVNEINTTPGLHHHYNLTGPAPAEPLANVVLRYAAAKRSSNDA